MPILSSTLHRLGDDGNGKYLIFGPGAHRIRSPFYNIGDHDVSIMTPVIMHGTWTIVTVRRRNLLISSLVNPYHVLLRFRKGKSGWPLIVGSLFCCLPACTSGTRRH